MAEHSGQILRGAGSVTNRRTFLSAGAALSGLVLLPGCAGLGNYSLVEAVRDLMSISSQRAFARLLEPGGFYDNEVSRIGLPDKLGGSGNILAAILQSYTFRQELQKQLNRAAEKGAERAAPVVVNTIRNIDIRDVAGIVRGGSTAATDYLRGEMSGALIDAMVPGMREGISLFDGGVIGKAMAAVSGLDVTSLARDLSDRADEAIWDSIGVEEAEIRENPQDTNNPAIIAVFGAGKLF